MIDFNNTEIAFERKSDKELKETAWLFRMMNSNFLVNFRKFRLLFVCIDLFFSKFHEASVVIFLKRLVLLFKSDAIFLQFGKFGQDFLPAFWR